MPLQDDRRPAGRLRWAYVLDLPSIHSAVQALEIAALDRPAFAGVEVTVRVGGHSPADFDYRLPTLIGNALRAGVDLKLEGHPSAVGHWWDEVDYYRRLAHPRRHLIVVRP